jgi:hypothetical protein
VPATPGEIYLEEASPYRPIATGDVFQGVIVPGCTEDEASHNLTMVVAHPSAMRKGATLEPRARAAVVAPVDGLSKKKWTLGYYDVFPLPRLSAVASQNGFAIADRGWAALLQIAAPIPTDALGVHRRVACLSPAGIHLLLQRVVHADTRFPVKEKLIEQVFAPKLEEIEMLQTWIEEFVRAEEEEADLVEALAAATQEFEAVMTEGDTPLRPLLESDEHVGEAQRLLAREMRRRRKGQQ